MEIVILSELFQNKKFLKKAIPYLKKKYFESTEDKHIYSAVRKFIYKYRKAPTISAILTILQNETNINENVYSNIVDRIEEIQSFGEKNEYEWLVDITEEFCRKRAFELALEECADISDQGGNIFKARELITDALKVSFDHHLGINFFDMKDVKERYDNYNEKSVKFKTHIDKLNQITGGGFEEKALHIFLADTHVGKTMTMCALAAGFVRNGYDVLYITLEMAEKKIAKLIDANFLDIKINDMGDVPEKDYIKSFKELSKQKFGTLYIREYPTTTAGSNEFRSLLDDLKHQKDFIPEIILVDYLNIAKCDRYSEGNSYTLVKGTAEELRGLGSEGSYCMISAAQTNRDGAKSSDISMTDTAESYGLPQTADLLIGLMTSEELREQNLIVGKSLKNRLTGIIGYKFPLKTQFDYAKLLDCDPEHEDMIHNDQKNTLMDKKQEMKAKLQALIVNNTDTNKSEKGLLDEV